MTERQPAAGIVIVAVDFSDASARAVALAGHVAHAWSARLIALHAESFDGPPYFTIDQVDRLMGERAALGAQAREYLSTFVASHTTTPAESEIESRVPTEAILHHADRAELVVMGTHGRRGPSRWWLGSVAERVLHDTPVPLLVVHADSPATVGASRRHRMPRNRPRGRCRSSRFPTHRTAGRSAGRSCAPPPGRPCSCPNRRKCDGRSVMGDGRAMGDG